MTVSTATHKTVNDAAAKFGKTPGRIRQLCIQYDIGTLIEGRIRLLTEFDLRRLSQIIEETGRDFSGKTSKKD